MMEISVNKLKKNYGFNNVLESLSFSINSGEKVAIIGQNGCGKTTTFRIIMGEEEADSGTVNIRKGLKLGYMKQIVSKEKEDVTALEVYLRGVKDLLKLEEELNQFRNIMTSSEKDIKKLTKLEEELKISGGYSLSERINRIKCGFKLSDQLLNSSYNVLSGGEKTIVNLASIILSNPDLLLLDEPTNHLDIETLEWFEEYLINYKGSVLIISHDRYFLDKVVNKIILIDNGKEDIYFGNYSYYLKESEKRELLYFESYKNQQKKIKAMKEAIKRLREWGQKSDNPIFFRRALSMEKRLARIEVLEKPNDKKKLPIVFKLNDRSGNEVIKINNLSLYGGEKELLDNAKLNIYYKDRICLMGNNGAGKTTLIKEIIKGNDNICIGSNVKMGLIPQEIRFDNDEETIYEHTRNIYVGSESELRSKLYQFYFEEDSLQKKLKSLSGGEKVRIKLLELILKNVNLLILDEPTNHIDIDTREILEDALLNFEGTILFISHDRYFIHKVSTRKVIIINKKINEFDGSYQSINRNLVNESKDESKDKNIIIDGSQRLKNFLIDSKIEQVLSSRIDEKEYKIKKKSKTFYLKIASHLSEESKRLDYLNGKTLIPEKVFYEKYNNKSYILTKALNGIQLDNEYYKDNKLEGIKIVVEAFNSIYNIDYSDCILDEAIDSKIAKIENRFDKINEKEINSEIMERFRNKQNIINYIKGKKPKQIIGFIHGNMTLSNIIALNGEFNGFKCINEAGMGDIYYDIVTCEISIEQNYGKEYIKEFYNELGIEKDEFKSDYYRIMRSL